MSVYTPVDADTLQQILTQYQVGALEGYEILPGGAVNTNYSVCTSKGHYVLTLFETLQTKDAEQFLVLLEWLATQGLPGARPLQTGSQNWTVEIFRRPSCLVTFLPGTHPTCPTTGQCEAIGSYLARLHTLQAPPPLPAEAFDAQRRKQTASLLHPMLNKKAQVLLDSAMEYNAVDASSLPVGLIHGDLFRDNALFDEDRLAGVIDFYFAFTGPYLYDLAIVLNDWACTSTGKCHEKRAKIILKSYEQVRPLSSQEKAQLGAFRIMAALRFWLSRLEANLLPQGGSQLPLRDPSIFEARLKALLELFS